MAAPPAVWAGGADMAINWDDTARWGGHVTESEWGTWLPEKTRKDR